MTKNLSFILLLAAVPALAQNRPVAEVAGGYQYVFDINALESVPQGYFVSGAWNATSWLAVVGELADSTKSLHDLSFGIRTLLGGVRLRKGGFFGQVLVGNFELDVFENDGDVERFTHTAVQPGVGWDIRIASRVSARIHVDYRTLLDDVPEYGREVRFAAGVAVGFGG